jgi:hypothetical protein
VLHDSCTSVSGQWRIRTSLGAKIPHPVKTTQKPGAVPSIGKLKKLSRAHRVRVVAPRKAEMGEFYSPLIGDIVSYWMVSHHLEVFNLLTCRKKGP